MKRCEVCFYDAVSAMAGALEVMGRFSRVPDDDDDDAMGYWQSLTEALKEYVEASRDQSLAMRMAVMLFSHLSALASGDNGGGENIVWCAGLRDPDEGRRAR